MFLESVLSSLPSGWQETTMASDALKSTLPSPAFAWSRNRCSKFELHSRAVQKKMTKLWNFNERKSSCKLFLKDGLNHELQFGYSDKDHDFDAFVSSSKLFANSCGHVHVRRDRPGQIRFAIGCALSNTNASKRKEIYKQPDILAKKNVGGSTRIYVSTADISQRKQCYRIALRGCYSQSEKCICLSNQSPRRFIDFTVAATADSGQTFPSQNEGGEKAAIRKPSPEIEPAEVIQAQLLALQERDIATVFEFASPKNRAHTGPLSRFTEMIEGRAYNVMIGHMSADVLSTVSIGPCRFQQRILIKGSNGNKAIFLWSLSKQEDGLFQGCWMIDSVHRDE